MAFAQLVPDLRAQAHAAAGTLLIFGAGNGGAARGDEAIETREPVRVNRLADECAGGIQRGHLIH